MKRIPSLVIAAVALVVLAAPSHGFDPAEVAAIKRQVQHGMNGGNPDAVVAARGRFAALSAAEPNSALLHYWVAFASWRAMPLIQRSDKAEAKRIGQDGIAHLDRTLEIDPQFAEALALKGSLQGMLIGAGGGSPMTLGPQSSANLDRAAGLAPKNPRIALLDGIGILHKPAVFGGGAKKALPRLTEALAFYASDAVSDSTQPDWGRDDVHVWIGRAHAAQKKWAEARDAFKQALEVNPDNGWVRHQLLPAAEKNLQRAAR